MINVALAPEHKATVERLGLLSDELKNKAVGSGLTAAAKPVKRTMAQLAPTDRGFLRQSINQTRVSKRASARLGLFGGRSEREGGEIAIVIGPNKKVPIPDKDKKISRSRVAQMLEEGTDPHTITPKAKGLLALKGGLFAKKVMHPGVRARHFMKRSLQRNQAQIESLFFQGVSKRIDRLL